MNLSMISINVFILIDWSWRLSFSISLRGKNILTGLGNYVSKLSIWLNVYNLFYFPFSCQNNLFILKNSYQCVLLVQNFIAKTFLSLSLWKQRKTTTSKLIQLSLSWLTLIENKNDHHAHAPSMSNLLDASFILHSFALHF